MLSAYRLSIKAQNNNNNNVTLKFLCRKEYPVAAVGEKESEIDCV